MSLVTGIEGKSEMATEDEANEDKRSLKFIKKF